MNQARCSRSVSACSLFAASAVAVVLGSTTGCSSDDPNKLMNGGQPAAAQSVQLDFTPALTSLKGQQFEKDPAYTRVSNIFLNKKDMTTNVAVWISTPAASDYLLIHPEDNPDTKPGPDKFLPVGTTIIRANYALSNTTDLTAIDKKITIMVKGPPGYLTGFGDWAFGVTDENGTPLNDTSTGQQELGLVSASCHLGCHENQRGITNDWLFGVEADARLSAN